MSNYSAGLDLNLRVAGAIAAARTGYSYDPNLPNCLNDGYFWRELWEYILNGTVPHYTPPTYCGVTVPDYSGTYALALAAANSLNLGVTEEDTAVTLCNKIVDYVGSPWNQ